jgi:hypothetical protein
MRMAANTRMSPWPSDGAAPRADVLSNVYRFILNCRANKKTAESTPELDSRNTRGESDGSRAKRITQN